MTDSPNREAPASEHQATISFGDFRLHRAGRLLLKDRASVRIGSRALDLLIALTDRPGEVVKLP